MAYTAKTLICHPECSAIEGDPVHASPKLLAQFLKDGIVASDEAGPELDMFPAEDDILESMDRGQLSKFILDNKLQKVISPKINWKDAQIRQAIRDICPDLSSMLPSAAPANFGLT